MSIVLCGGVCVHKTAKSDMSMEPKITGSKIFIFKSILEFQKHFHYTEANAVYFSATAQLFAKYVFFKFSQAK
jgi:hypothetical protein